MHSIGAGARFDERDHAAASAFATAAERAGVRRIIYLGGLSDETTQLSRHLASRAEVGRILAGSGVETIILQAAMITAVAPLFTGLRAVRSGLTRLRVDQVASTRASLAYSIGVFSSLTAVNHSDDGRRFMSRVQSCRVTWCVT